MQIISPINIPFYLFTASKELQTTVYNHVVNLQFQTDGEDKYGFIYPNYFHPQLFDFFDQSISAVQKLLYKDHLKFPVTDCWVNKYTTSNILKKHNHPNSIICGVYYVTTHRGYGSTVFESPNPWNFLSPISTMPLTVNKSANNNLRGEVPAQAGSLILFPPSLAHYMDVIEHPNTVRYTIAFNTFVSGVIDNSDTRKLTINTLPLRNKFKIVAG